jgi:alkylation response protein AidB-like acyl-CoA dehydrogenase
MDLSYGKQYEDFRTEVAAFLAGNWPPPDVEGRDAQMTEFRKRATERGYLYRGIPRRYGGSEQPADLLRALIIGEEFARVHAPRELAGAGVGHLIGTLLECGTEWQRQQFIPKTITGEYFWAQGYSEPGAGSDLASLRTRAELKDGKWVINGQKIWSSFAYRAQYMFLLARTESQGSRHAGISYLLLDLRQPGVRIQRIRQITGQSEFCEVFFTDAVTPEDWIVGKRGEGWNISRVTLKHERSSGRGVDWASAHFGWLVEFAKKASYDGRPAIENPEIRRQLAVIQGYVEAMRYSAFRQISMEAHGQDPGMFRSLMKFNGSEIAQKIALLGARLLGDDLMLLDMDSTRESRHGSERWVHLVMAALVLAIAGGSTNIQRNIISERSLGLPRDNG